MGGDSDRWDRKWISLPDGSGPPWKTLSTAVYMTMALATGTMGYVLARPARIPEETYKTMIHMPLRSSNTKNTENMLKFQQDYSYFSNTSRRTVSLVSLPILPECQSLPSVFLKKWTKKHTLLSQMKKRNLEREYDTSNISTWVPYYDSSKVQKKLFSKSCKFSIRQLYPFKSKRPSPCIVSIHDVDCERPSSIFSMDSIYEFSNDSMVFSDPEFTSCKYLESPYLNPSLNMRNKPLKICSMTKQEKKLSNKDFHIEQETNVCIDKIFETVNPLSKLTIDDKSTYETSDLSNKLFSTTTFLDENSFDKIQLPLEDKKSVDNLSNDILWDNSNETDYNDQKNIFESSASTNTFLMDERISSIYSKHEEFQWDEGFTKEGSNETWDEDFDTDLVVPIDIVKQQDTIKSHLGSIRKFASLIEDLKNLKRIAEKEGDKDEIWPEVEAIIALGTLENDVPDMHEVHSLNNSIVNEKQDMLREVIMRAVGKQFPMGERIGLDPDNLPGFVNYASSLKERCQGIIDPIYTFSNTNC